MLGLSLFTAQLVLAQDAAPAQPAASPASQAAVNDVARQLWCPLCSGVRLDACELKACDQMKDQIAEKLAAGDSLQMIKDYFVRQYGPQVLGEPPMEGFNWLAWVLPVVALLAGGIFVWTWARRTVRAARPVSAAGDGQAAPDAGDPYEQKLTEELKQYD